MWVGLLSDPPYLPLILVLNMWLDCRQAQVQKVGMPMAHYELHAWIVLLLGWVFLPFYMRGNVFTMPEFLEKRFDSRSRWFLSIFSIIGYVLTKVSVTIYAGGCGRFSAIRSLFFDRCFWNCHYYRTLHRLRRDEGRGLYRGLCRP